MNSCLVLKMVVSYFLEASSEFGKQNPKQSQPLMTLCQSRVVISLPSRMGVSDDWMCLICVCLGKGKYWENWETFVLLMGSRLARRFSFLISGPGAQASCGLLMFSQRPPGWTAGLLLGKVCSPHLHRLGVSWLKMILQTCEKNLFV